MMSKTMMDFIHTSFKFKRNNEGNTFELDKKMAITNKKCIL